MNSALAEPPSSPTTRAYTPILLAVLTLAVGGLGTYLSCLQLEANDLDHARNALDHARNQLEHDRKLPSVHVYAETWDVVKHAETVDTAMLLDELDNLETEHRRYSGRSIVDVRFSLLEHLLSDGDETLQPSEAREYLVNIRQEVQSLRDDRIADVPSLIEELDALLASWRSEAEITPAMTADLQSLERRYSDYTGRYVLDLQEALKASAERDVATPEAAVRVDNVDDAVSLLEYVSAALRDNLAYDGPGFDALLEDLNGIVQTYVEGKEGQRLTVEAVVENQSQLATMIRRKARVKLLYEAGTLEKDVGADSDLNLNPYSVGAVTFVSEDLDASEVAIIAKHRDGITCELAVLDLRQKLWRGECRSDNDAAFAHLLREELRTPAEEGE